MCSHQQDHRHRVHVPGLGPLVEGVRTGDFLLDETIGRLVPRGVPEGLGELLSKGAEHSEVRVRRIP